MGDFGTGSSLKDKNEAKPDKTEHGIGKSTKNQGQGFYPLTPLSYYSWSLGYEDGESSAAGAKLGRAIQEIAPTTLEGVNQRVTELVTTVDQEDEIIYSQLDDARYDRALLRARVNMLYRDRPFHRRTAL
ncbi:hypothetical protein Tco_1449819 [Tanacetum coccineum]